MKKQLKTAAVMLILAVSTTAAFAADYSTTITDVDSIHDLAKAEMLVAFGTSSADQNVALVSQTGDENIAYIQQTGSGNFAATIQDASTVAAVAYTIQTGNNNRAVVYQH